jgi:hypothetical protein
LYFQTWHLKKWKIMYIGCAKFYSFSRPGSWTKKNKLHKLPLDSQVDTWLNWQNIISRWDEFCLSIHNHRIKRNLSRAGSSCLACQAAGRVHGVWLKSWKWFFFFFFWQACIYLDVWSWAWFALFLHIIIIIVLKMASHTLENCYEVSKKKKRARDDNGRT